MARNTRTTAVGVFESRAEAQQAVAELRRMGFSEDEIGVATRDEDGGAEHRAAGDDDSGSHAATGAAAGAAAGAGVGALWGLGIMAGLLPAIGPVIAGGTLAAILASAATGAAAAGLAGALIGLGIPEEEAEYYEGEVGSGRTVVTVKAGDRYDEARQVLQRYRAYDFETRNTGREARSNQASTTGAAGRTVTAHEEQVQVRKTPQAVGEVVVHKEVHTEHRSIDVPVKKEEIVVERRAASGTSSDEAIGEGQEIRVPVVEEQIHVEKRPVATEEVRVSKRQSQDTQRVDTTVKKEEIKVDQKGDAKIRDKRRD